MPRLSLALSYRRRLLYNRKGVRLRLFTRIDIDLFSIFLTIILFAGSRYRSDRGNAEYRLFTLLLSLTGLELAADAAISALEGTSGVLCRAIALTATTVYYIGFPFAAMVYVFYAEDQVAANSRRDRSWMRLVALPAAASALLSLSTPATGLYFYLDARNAYHRGPLFLILVSVAYSYMVFSMVVVVAAARRRAIDRATLATLLAFPLPPIIAGALQIRYFGLVLVWPAATLSLLVIFIHTQRRKLSSDYLTGAFNRRRLDEYVEERVRDFREERVGAGRRGRRFAGLLADVDDFKLINDRFGHAAGDEALVLAVQLIRSCLRTDDFLARYAGDEFVAILPLSNEAELDQVVGRIHARFADRVFAQGLRERLSLSIGSAVFDPEVDKDADKYVARLDYLMYLEKMNKKAFENQKPMTGEDPLHGPGPFRSDRDR